MQDDAPSPRSFESPLSDADVGVLARLLFAGVPALSGSITASDAGRVLGALASMMAKAREHTRETARIEEAEIGRYEYVPPHASRGPGGALQPSDIVMDLLTSPEMQAAFALLLGILQAVRQMAEDGLPFGALQGYASTQGGQAIRLLWYLRAKESGDLDPDKANRMRELRPAFRTWANTLPATERSLWLQKTNLQLKKSLDDIEAQGWVIWNTWGGYLRKLGYRISNYAPGHQWDLPIYEPFDGRAIYFPPAVDLLPVLDAGPKPST